MEEVGIKKELRSKMREKDDGGYYNESIDEVTISRTEVRGKWSKDNASVTLTFSL